MPTAMVTFDISHKTDTGNNPPQSNHYAAAEKAANSFGLKKTWTSNKSTQQCPNNTFVGDVAAGTKATVVVAAIKKAVEREQGAFTTPKSYCLIASHPSSAGGLG